MDLLCAVFQSVCEVLIDVLVVAAPLQVLLKVTVVIPERSVECMSSLQRGMCFLGIAPWWIAGGTIPPFGS